MDNETLLKTLGTLTEKETNSVTVKQTAKGEMYFDVKMRFESGKIDDLMNELNNLYDKLIVFKSTYLGKV